MRVKKELHMIIENSSTELAVEEVLHLFSVSKRYSLNYLDEFENELHTEIWAKDQDKALYELRKIEPKATYIFISRL